MHTQIKRQLEWLYYLDTIDFRARKMTEIKWGII